MRCGANNMHHGSEVTCRCTITMPPPSHPNLPSTSWINIRFHKCHSPPVHWTLLHVTFFLFLEVKMLLKGNRFQDTEEIK